MRLPVAAESAVKQLKKFSISCLHFQPGSTDCIPAVNTAVAGLTQSVVLTVHLNRCLKRCTSEVACFYILEQTCVMHSFVTLKTDRKEFSIKSGRENSAIIVHFGNCMHKTMVVRIRQQQDINTEHTMPAGSQQHWVKLEALIVNSNLKVSRG